jgi:hypothetical protein
MLPISVTWKATPSSPASCARTGTIIRTDFKRWQIALILVAELTFLPAGHGAEMEIYVTKGPDGVEIFSNLPRTPVAAPGKPAGATKGSAAVVVPQPVRQPLSVTAVSSGQGSDTEASGKSFLEDD